MARQTQPMSQSVARLILLSPGSDYGIDSFRDLGRRLPLRSRLTHARRTAQKKDPSTSLGISPADSRFAHARRTAQKKDPSTSLGISPADSRFAHARRTAQV